jgi:hypothetical protein
LSEADVPPQLTSTNPQLAIHKKTNFFIIFDFN